MSPINSISCIMENVFSSLQHDVTLPWFYWMGTKCKEYSWFYMAISAVLGVTFARVILTVLNLTIRYIIRGTKKRPYKKVSFYSKSQSVEKEKDILHRTSDEQYHNMLESDFVNDKKELKNCHAVPQLLVASEQNANSHRLVSTNTNDIENSGHSNWSANDFKKASSMPFQRPSFIKGDIDIDPEKCQGFFSRGSITFTASTKPGEPSRLSIEYDEEMSKLINSIVRKKSRHSFISLQRSVGISEENFGWFAVGACLSLCIFSMVMARRYQ